jgi:thiamine transporter ThiT
MSHPSSRTLLAEDSRLKCQLWGTRLVAERLKYLVWFIRGVVGFAGGGGVSELGC